MARKIPRPESPSNGQQLVRDPAPDAVGGERANARPCSLTRAGSRTYHRHPTFSISLAVNDLATSRAFYEKLGFEVTGGSPEHSYLIMVNGESVIGLFQGMFERNILTFNPGWDGPGRESRPDFQDVREIAASLTADGIELTDSKLPEEGGPGHVAFLDPDGNPILIDQHR